MSQNVMKRDWDERVKAEPLHAVDDQSLTEEELRASGAADAEVVLADVGQYLTSDASVLEVGCGIGRLLEPLAGRFREVCGVDVSGEMVARGRLRLAHLDNVRFVENNGSDLEGIPHEHFDLCYSAWALQHVPDRSAIRRYITEAHRVLKRGGILKFQVWGVYAVNPFRKLYDDSGVDTYYGVRFTMSEIVSMVEEASFQMIAAYHAHDRQVMESHNPETKQQRTLWVVARKGRGVDEWESVCFDAGRALARVVPEGASVILLEPETAAHLVVAGAAGVRFLSLYAPGDSAGGIRELERLRSQGGRYLVLTRHGFWWLDYYRSLFEYVDSHYRRIDQAPGYLLFCLD
jgi:ubiquinone/menaquinone biosynthesis C-methylase UbiE